VPMVDSSLAEREEVPITSKDVPAPHTHPGGEHHDVSPDGKASLQGKSSQVNDHHFVKLRKPFTSRLLPGLRLVHKYDVTVRRPVRYSRRPRGVPAGSGFQSRQTRKREPPPRPGAYGPWGQRRPMASPAPR